jgi:hypothetical protein
MQHAHERRERLSLLGQQPLDAHAVAMLACGDCAQPERKGPGHRLERPQVERGRDERDGVADGGGGGFVAQALGHRRGHEHRRGCVGREEGADGGAVAVEARVGERHRLGADEHLAFFGLDLRGEAHLGVRIEHAGQAPEDRHEAVGDGHFRPFLLDLLHARDHAARAAPERIRLARHTQHVEEVEPLELAARVVLQGGPVGDERQQRAHPHPHARQREQAARPVAPDVGEREANEVGEAHGEEGFADEA